MKIKTFLFFPETNEDFVRIGDDPKSYKDLVGIVALIKYKLKKHKNFELFFDSSNVNLFLTKAEALIDKIHLTGCRKQLQTLMGNDCRNVNTTHSRNTDCIYANWNSDFTAAYANNIFSEAYEAKFREGHDKTILINISNAYPTIRNNAHVIKDAIHHDELPQLIAIPILNNEKEFLEWYSTSTNNGFSLKDKNRFQLTAFKWEKQSIYKETLTGHYWYFDYFHKENKIHYEVFNEAGVHLGEASINGILDLTKEDGTKRIDDIIH